MRGVWYLSSPFQKPREIIVSGCQPRFLAKWQSLGSTVRSTRSQNTPVMAPYVLVREKGNTFPHPHSILLHDQFLWVFLISGHTYKGTGHCHLHMTPFQGWQWLVPHLNPCSTTPGLVTEALEIPQPLYGSILLIILTTEVALLGPGNRPCLPYAFPSSSLLRQ